MRRAIRLGHGRKNRLNSLFQFPTRIIVGQADANTLRPVARRVSWIDPRNFPRDRHFDRIIQELQDNQNIVTELMVFTRVRKQPAPLELGHPRGVQRRLPF